VTIALLGQFLVNVESLNENDCHKVLSQVLIHGLSFQVTPGPRQTVRGLGNGLGLAVNAAFDISVNDVVCLPLIVMKKPNFA